MKFQELLDQQQSDHPDPEPLERIPIMIPTEQWRSRQAWGRALPKGPKFLADFWGPSPYEKKILVQKQVFFFQYKTSFWE